MSTHKKKWIARLAFDVVFEAASPNKAVEQGEKIADELATLVFAENIPVVASTGAMIARLSPADRDALAKKTKT